MAFLSFMSGMNPQDEINRELYRRADLVAQYAKVELHPAEAVLLVRYRDHVQNCRVLDLGCGAGRLAMYLRPLSNRYVGVDISEHMIAYCREHLDGLSFFRADLRQLPFATGAFDSVFAMFNLIDVVGHEDRLSTLAQLRRILRPGGLLFFSSHNRNWTGAGAIPKLQFQLNPVNQLRELLIYCRCRANHRRIKANQQATPEYAILNDDGHEFALLHYYISRAAQARQLCDAGFELLECLNEDGQVLRPEDDDSAFSTIHYIARS